MINMFVIIVILVNILIGQLSYRYETAIEEAEIQYSIDKAKFITRLEKSRFRNRVRLRWIFGVTRATQCACSLLV